MFADSSVRELAELFLSGEPEFKGRPAEEQERMVDWVSLEIQDTIENAVKTALIRIDEL